MYCRLCLNKFTIKEFLSLLSSEDGIDWRKLCWQYLRIEIRQTDIYSKGICQKCSKILKEFHAFCQHSLHCQQILPLIHLKLKETGILTIDQHNAMIQAQLNENITLKSYETKNISDVKTEIGSNDLPKQKAVFVISEKLENESNLQNACTRNNVKRLRTCDEDEQSTIVVKTEILESDTDFGMPITEHILPDTQTTSEEFQTTLAIKVEPLENAFDEEMSQTEMEVTAPFSAVNAMEMIKHENDFETTEYELQEMALKNDIVKETSIKKFKTSFKDNFNWDENKQNMEESKSLRQIDSPFDLPEKMFRKIYSLSPELTQILIENLDAQLKGTRITAISSEKLVLAALRFFATGFFQDPVGELWGINMSQPSISRAIHKVTDAINAKMCQQHIRFPMTSHDRQVAKSVFASAAYPFIGAIGAIDCMHVAILAPTGEQTYLNEDGYHSINVQMICDPNLKILNVNARYPGSKDNAYIWNASVARSVMKKAFDNVDRYAFLIGDSKYPLEPWLMTPFPNAVAGTPQALYNETLCNARYPVQRLFAVLRKTWRCLSGQRELKYNPQFAGRIVNACSVLHNLQLIHQELNIENILKIEHPEDNFCVGEYKSPSTDLVLTGTAKNIRNRIILNYFSKH